MEHETLAEQQNNDEMIGIPQNTGTEVEQQDSSCTKEKEQLQEILLLQSNFILSR